MILKVMVTAVALFVLKISFVSMEDFYDMDKGKPISYRLPKTTKPNSYNMTLVIDPEKSDKFMGEVRIQIEAVLITKQIVIHSKNLVIYDIQVMDINRNIYSEHKFDPGDKNFLRISLQKELEIGRIYQLNIVYIGRFGANMRGVYLSSYMDNAEAKKYLASTHFQPVYARNAFPCYDEPSLKATFNVNIYAPRSYNVISNTEEVPSYLPKMKNFKSISFKTTPLMSTYLVAFVISDFDFKSNLIHGPPIFAKEFRIYAKPDSRLSLDYSLELSQNNIMYLERYTGINYRLNKLHYVAIPNMEEQAMENWGLVLFKEKNLLFDNVTTTTEDKQYIATTVSHENAHMWFGNEVSPEWWDCLWLNEGFASYFEYHITDMVMDGKWRMDEQFVVRHMQEVMFSDSAPSTNSLTSKVESPSEIEAQFNQIAFRKAASVIRMMEHTLTEPIFRRGLVYYLNFMQLGVSKPETLFEHMQKALEGFDHLLPGKVTIGDVFGLWSNQSGYPVVYALRQGSHITIRQERYFRNYNTTSSEQWLLPLTWTTNLDCRFNSTTTREWLLPFEGKTISIDKGVEWFAFNIQQTGYYRVMYDTDNWMKLIVALNGEDHKTIHPLNKAQLIDDAFEFSRTFKMSYNLTFGLISYLRHELDYIPWLSARRGLSYLDSIMFGSKHHNRYTVFMRHLTLNLYESMGFEVNDGDDHITKLNRVLAINMACKYGNLECVDTAKKKFEALINGEDVHIDFQEFLYCFGIKNGDDKLWHFLYEKYLNATSKSERAVLMSALSCSENVTILQKYLSMSVNDDLNIKIKDVSTMLLETMSKNIGLGVVLDFVDENFHKLHKKFGGLDSVIERLSNKIVQKEHAFKLRHILVKNKSNFKARTLKENAPLNYLERNQEVISNLREDIDAWLFDNVKCNEAFVGKNSFALITCLLISLLVF